MVEWLKVTNAMKAEDMFTNQQLQKIVHANTALFSSLVIRSNSHSHPLSNVSAPAGATRPTDASLSQKNGNDIYISQLNSKTLGLSCVSSLSKGTQSVIFFA